MELREFDLRRLPDSFFADPYPIYHKLRDLSPRHRLPDGSWFLTRHADLTAVYRDPRFSSDKHVEFAPKFGVGTPLYTHHTTSLVFSDPPYHTRVRRLIAGALTPRAVKAMEAGLVQQVDTLLDRLAQKGEGDLIGDFACQIPIEIIGNLLNVPHAERGPLRAWSLAILGALEPQLSEEQLANGNQSVQEFSAYLEILIADRRKNLLDDTDILSRLIRGEPNGEKLTHDELIQNCIFLLNAGHETTTNLIGNGLHLMLTHGDARRQLLANPDLIGSAIEEVLRYESSNQLGNRRAVEAVDFDGLQIEEGGLITLCIGAANRDPDVFSDPGRFEIARAPNKHLAFGAGPHLCAGNQLARLEGQIAISRFLLRFPNAELSGSPVRARRARFRGFDYLAARL
jgi:cytochrome P450